MDILTRIRLTEILKNFQAVRVGVIGDFNLDGYWYADMTRSELSREAPLFPRPVIRESYTPGGAANVAWNLAALKVLQVRAFGVLGRDWRRSLLEDCLTRSGVDLRSMLTCSDWITPFYGKVILTAGELEQEDARLDFVNSSPLPAQAQADLIAQVQSALPELDALVVADYLSNGVMTTTISQALNHMANENPGIRFIADSRAHAERFKAMFIKPNEVEAAHLFFPGLSPVPQEELELAALSFHQSTGRPLVITQGSAGCILLEGSQIKHIPAVQVPPPIDTVGAGDTFLASLSVSLAAGARPWEACAIATLTAAISIRCLRVTGTASPDQILEQFDRASSSTSWIAQ